MTEILSIDYEKPIGLVAAREEVEKKPLLRAVFGRAV
jgi:hypothetical protein